VRAALEGAELARAAAAPGQQDAPGAAHGRAAAAQEAPAPAGGGSPGAGARRAGRRFALPDGLPAERGAVRQGKRFVLPEQTRA